MTKDDSTDASHLGNLVETRVNCPACGYNLTGGTIGAGCPECGWIIGDGLIPEEQTPTSVRAVLALGMGFFAAAGWLWFGPLCFIAGPFAVQAALRAKIQAERGEITAASGKVAHVGLVCGFAGTGLGILFAVYLLLAIMF